MSMHLVLDIVKHVMFTLVEHEPNMVAAENARVPAQRIEGMQLALAYQQYHCPQYGMTCVDQPVQYQLWCPSACALAGEPMHTCAWSWPRLCLHLLAVQGSPGRARDWCMRNPNGAHLCFYHYPLPRNAPCALQLSAPPP
eukprot:scaffold153224_cov18-Tisochrysis_lutea.AAC.3